VVYSALPSSSFINPPFLSTIGKRLVLNDVLSFSAPTDNLGAAVPPLFAPNSPFCQLVLSLSS